MLYASVCHTPRAAFNINAAFAFHDFFFIFMVSQNVNKESKDGRDDQILHLWVCLL